MIISCTLKMALAAAMLMTAGWAPAAAFSRSGSKTYWQVLLAAPAVSLPRAIAIDPRGTSPNKWAYTTDAATQRVVKFGTGGKLLGSWQYGDPRRGNAASIAVGGSGNIFVANPSDNRLSKFSPTGRLLARWSGFSGLRALVLDRSGNIYLAENQTHRITELSPSGVLLTRWDVRTLWNGSSAGNPTGLALGPGGAVYVATRCEIGPTGSTCGPRIAYLSGSTPEFQTIVDIVMPLRTQGLQADERGTVGLGVRGAGFPPISRDTCNHRFLLLQTLADDPSGRLYVAGLLWPRAQAAPALAIGLGAGTPGCTHDGIGPSWQHWPLPLTRSIHGLAVDGRGAIYLSQSDRIWKLSTR